jgi:hypothetical protein
MGHIFFSYAREDRGRAELLATALQQEGWSVWWDRNIPAGRTFDEVIEQALDSAACVVVLWSRQSVNNRWVRSEAEEGAMRGTLVPVLLEQVRIPLAFRRIQAADLVEWMGDRRDPTYLQLLADIAALLGRSPGQNVTVTQTPARRGPSRNMETVVVDPPALPPMPSGRAVDPGPEPPLPMADPSHGVRREDADAGGYSRPSALEPGVGYLQLVLKLQMVVAAVAAVATVINIESIIVALPVVAALGLILIAFGVHYHARDVWLAGTAGPALGALHVLLINVLDWGPDEAHAPLATITLVWAVAYIFLLRRLTRPRT